MVEDETFLAMNRDIAMTMAETGRATIIASTYMTVPSKRTWFPVRSLQIVSRFTGKLSDKVIKKNLAALNRASNEVA